MERAGRHENYDDLAEEIFRLREEKEKALTDENARNQYLERMTELKEFIDSQPDSITEFDERDLMIDSSKFGIEGSAQLIIDALTNRIKDLNFPEGSS